jgi:hypothetical protein
LGEISLKGKNEKVLLYTMKRNADNDSLK